MEKYDFNEQDANQMAEFLVPILDFVPENRPSAGQCLLHPWMNAGPRLLEPSLNPSTSEENKKENEDEAMEVRMRKIAITSDSEQANDSQEFKSKISKANA